MARVNKDSHYKVGHLSFGRSGDDLKKWHIYNGHSKDDGILEANIDSGKLARARCEELVKEHEAKNGKTEKTEKKSNKKAEK